MISSPTEVSYPLNFYHTCITLFQAVRLVFHTFITHNANDYLKVYESTGTQLVAGKIYGTQTGRQDIIVHDSGALIKFKTDTGSAATGFKIEFQCYTLAANGESYAAFFFYVGKESIKRPFINYDLGWST